MAGSNDKTTSLAKYLTELTLLDADTYLPFVPSIIGKSLRQWGLKNVS